MILKASEINSITVKQVPSSEWSVFINGIQATAPGVKSYAEAVKSTYNRDLKRHGELKFNVYE